MTKCSAPQGKITSLNAFITDLLKMLLGLKICLKLLKPRECYDLGMWRVKQKITELTKTHFIGVMVNKIKGTVNQPQPTLNIKLLSKT